MIDNHTVTILVSAIGGLGGLLAIFWKKFLKPIVKLCKNQDFFVESVEEIKKELTTNGGGSLKDAIIGMRQSCERIENRQRVIIQRTKQRYITVAQLCLRLIKKVDIWSNVNLMI